MILNEQLHVTLGTNGMGSTGVAQRKWRIRGGGGWDKVDKPPDAI